MNQAVQVFGMADFERTFGAVNSGSLASYQIAQFFLNGGPSAWVVRVVASSSADSITASKAAYPSPGTAVAQAKSEGTWANDNVRFSVEAIADASSPTGLSTTNFNVYINRYAPTTHAVVASEQYLNVSTSTTSASYFINVINNGSQLLQFVSGATLPNPNGTIGKPISTTTPPKWSTFSTNTFTVAYGTIGSVTATVPSLDDGSSLSTVAGALQAAIRAAAVTGPAPLSAITVSAVGNVMVAEIPAQARGYDAASALKFTETSAGIVAATGLTSPAAYENAQEYSLTGGADGIIPYVANSPLNTTEATSFATALIGDQSLKTGLYALENADLFNLLSLPISVELDGASSSTYFTAIVSHALAYCASRRAMMLIDIPKAIDTPALMEQWFNANATTIASPNAAFYFPRVKIPDPNNGYQATSFASSGTIAGIYATTDTDRGVWKAPAGVDARLTGVSSLDYQLTDGENGALNPLGINCLRVFPVYGIVTWGTRTGQGADAQASQWKYIPVRRLALMIEESLFRGTKWVVFEPNDEPLWAKIRQNVGAFMNTLFRQGAFAGSTPQQAYFVKCDSTTTTPTDQANGVVNIQVGFAPLEPAEFVVLQIQQMQSTT